MMHTMYEKIFNWATGIVTRGEFLVACLIATVTIASAIITLSITTDQKIDRVEKEMAPMLARISANEIMLTRDQIVNSDSIAKIRVELLARLDSIGADLVVMKVELVKSRNR